MASSCTRKGLDWTLVKTFFTERVVMHWTKLSSNVVKSPSLGIFKRCMDVALWDMV